MKSTVVVVTDLAGFKAFRLDNDPSHSTPRLELLEQFENPDAQTRLVDQVTDLSGRFPRGAAGSEGTKAMSDGERHNIGLERRKRAVRQLAERLNSLMGSAWIEKCYLAASKEINHHLLEELAPQVRAKIEKLISADLVKIHKSELLQHFVV